ncbi:hypothetical protein JCM5296_001177 [Sporobolomyces johnsonii]
MPADHKQDSEAPPPSTTLDEARRPGGETSAGEQTLPGDRETGGEESRLSTVEEASEERDGSEPSPLAGKGTPWVVHSPKESKASVIELERRRLARGTSEKRVEIEPDGYATDDGLKRERTEDGIRGMAAKDPFADILGHPLSDPTHGKGKAKTTGEPAATQTSKDAGTGVEELRQEMARQNEVSAKQNAELQAQLASVMKLLELQLGAKGREAPESSSRDDREADKPEKHKKQKPDTEPEGSGSDAGSTAESDGDEKRSKTKVDLRALGKPMDPPKYSGEDDRPRTLIDWAQAVQGMLLAANLDVDSLRAGMYVGGHLSGRASRLFLREILPEISAHYKTGKRKSKSPWPFDRIVLLFRERFVSESAVRDAQQRWRTLSQRRKDGSFLTVNDLATRLEEYGEERQETTPHDFKVRFIDALIPDIARRVMEDLDIDDVTVTFHDVVKRAVKAEHSWLQLRAAREAERRGVNFSNYEAYSASGTYAREIRRGRDSPREQRERPERRKQSNKLTGEESRRARDDNRAPRRARNDNGTKPEQVNRYGVPRSEMQRRESQGACYACGESGHRIGDCPSKQKESKGKTPTLNSVRVLGEEDHSDTSASDSDTDRDGKTSSDDEDEPPELEPIGESQRATPDVSGGELEDDQLKSSYPRSIRVPIGINGTDNLSATVDMGASHTFLHPNAARVANVKVQRYIKPKTLKLGTKGSRAKINAYAFIDLHIGGEVIPRRVEIGSVEDDILLGRDFLRPHRCKVEFDPDVLSMRKKPKRSQNSREGEPGKVRVSAMNMPPADEPNLLGFPS